MLHLIKNLFGWNKTTVSEITATPADDADEAFNSEQNALAHQLLDDAQKKFLHAWHTSKFGNQSVSLYDQYNDWKYAQIIHQIAENKLNVEFNQGGNRFKPYIADDAVNIPRYEEPKAA